MTEELKPCPFCGSEAEFNSDEFGECVCCKSCGATLHNGVYGEEGRKLASADWNARPIENELNEKIEKLEKENHILRLDLAEIARGFDVDGFDYTREGMMRMASEALKTSKNCFIS